MKGLLERNIAIIEEFTRIHDLTYKLKTMDVPEERLELSRDNSQRLLRPQRLPISPSGLIKKVCKYNFSAVKIY